MKGEAAIRLACALEQLPSTWIARRPPWLMDLDIAVLHGRPGHPQTQGKEERFHRTLKQEVLQGRDFADLSAAQLRFDPWRQTYNQERPHEALDLDVPANRYRVSWRPYRAEAVETTFEYDVSFTVRRVRQEGRIRLGGGKDYFVGGAFGGRRVGRSCGRCTTGRSRWRPSTREPAEGRPLRFAPLTPAAAPWGLKVLPMYPNTCYPCVRPLQQAATGTGHTRTRLTGHYTTMESRTTLVRSEERRVGKGCRSRWSPHH